MNYFEFDFGSLKENGPFSSLEALLHYLKNYRYYLIKNLKSITVEKKYKFSKKDLDIFISHFYNTNISNETLIKFLEEVDLIEIEKKNDF